MGTVRRVTPRELSRALKRDMRKLGTKTNAAVKKAAGRGATHIRRTAPKAFGDIADGIEMKLAGRGARIVSTAPHAAAVEVGSRPHFPPIAPIEAWVKLRGMQGLTKTGRISKKRGGVARMIADQGDGESTSLGAARAVAYMIARAISIRGTKPHWYMRNALPRVRELVDQYVTQALKNQSL